MITKEKVIVPKMNKKIIVDLNNFLFEDPNTIGKAKMIYVEKLEVYLTNLGYNNVIFIAGPKLRFFNDDNKKYEKLIKEKKIYQSPAMVDSDWYILSFAKKNNCDILTNDKYKEYWNEFGKEWIMEKRKTFMLVDEQISIKN